MTYDVPFDDSRSCPVGRCQVGPECDGSDPLTACGQCCTCHGGCLLRLLDVINERVDDEEVT